MLDGFYSMAFTGVAGSGFGVIVFQNGVIVGADAAGAIYDGSYSASSAQVGGFEVRVAMNAPPGATLVQTGLPLTEAMKLSIEALLPTNFASGTPVLLHTPLGPVNIAFKKIRDISG